MYAIDVQHVYLQKHVHAYYYLIFAYIIELANWFDVYYLNVSLW